MSTLFDNIINHINQIGACALIVIGLYIVVMHTNMIKRIIGINIFGTGVFYFFVSIGYVRGGAIPIVNGDESGVMINPLPSVLILTGIVVVVSITVYAMSLVIKIYEGYGTMDQAEITKMKSGENND